MSDDLDLDALESEMRRDPGTYTPIEHAMMREIRACHAYIKSGALDRIRVATVRAERTHLDRAADLDQRLRMLRCEGEDWPPDAWPGDERSRYLDGYEAALRRVRAVLDDARP